MAIQVGGTTVISDTRVLSSVTGLKTVGGTSILGSGDIATGGSTTFGAVGTYSLVADRSYSRAARNEAAGGTVAGSTITPVGLSPKDFEALGTPTTNTVSQTVTGATDTSASRALSGTWRKMNATITNAYVAYYGGSGPIYLAIRIS
jgi:hypothetical protein